jgi:hypothetical protein
MCTFTYIISVHRKKRFHEFPVSSRDVTKKLPLGRNNSVMTSLFPPRESLVRLGTGNFRTFFTVYYTFVLTWWHQAGIWMRGLLFLGAHQKLPHELRTSCIPLLVHVMLISWCTLPRKTRVCVPRKGNAGPHFPISTVMCLWAIMYSHDPSTYFHAAEYADRILGIYISLTETWM